MKIFKSIIEKLKRFWTFVGETRTELRKVSWPDRNEIYSTTLVVILTSFFFGFYLFLVDIGCQNGIQWITQLFR